MIIVVCIIPCIGFKVCQPFSLISPNPPPSQFATFPFAGSGSREQEPDPLPSSILFSRIFSLEQCASVNLLVKHRHKLDLLTPPIFLVLHFPCAILLPSSLSFLTLSSSVGLHDSASIDRCSFAQKCVHVALPLPLHCNAEPTSHQPLPLLSVPLTCETFLFSLSFVPPIIQYLKAQFLPKLMTSSSLSSPVLCHLCSSCV